MIQSKIAVLSFSKLSNAPGVSNFEQVFLYGMLGKLALFTNFTCRDLATKSDQLALPIDISFEQLLNQLSTLSQEHNARYVLTGSITPDLYDYPESDKIIGLKIALRLFDNHEKRFIADSIHLIQTFSPGKNFLQDISIPIETYQELVNWATFEIIDAISPTSKQSLSEAIKNYELSTSYEAIKMIVKADQLSHSPSEKILLYESAIKLDPELEIGYFNLGNLYKFSQEYRKSVYNYRKAMEVSKSSNKLKSLYATEAGVCCALLGHTEPAIQWWNQAIQYTPEYINPYMNIALAYEELEQLEKAESFLLKAQALAPADFRLYYSLARIYSKQSQWEKAIDQYKRNLSLDGNDPWCHGDIATCYLQAGDDQSALKHLQKTVSLDPEGEAGQYAQLILTQLTIE